LEKGRDVTGVVRQTGGAPLAEADVVLVSAGRDAFFQQARRPDQRNSFNEQTDARGRFRFPPQDASYTVVVLHDHGFARIDSAALDREDAVVVRPWGRVEGVLRIGSQPAAGEPVVLYTTPEENVSGGHISFMWTATTDSEGRFGFDRVRPGRAYAARTIKLNSRDTFQVTMYANTTHVTVESGRTTRVEIGGTGRPVVGRVVIGEGTAGRVDLSRGYSRIAPSQKPAEPPRGLSPAEKSRWLKTWLESDQGQTYQREAARTFPVKIEADGSFRAEDVPAGSYQLFIQVQGPPAAGRGGFGETIASATRDIAVPPMPNGRSDEPLDVGTLELKLATRLNPGEPAPEFTVKTLDGKPLKLADYRGKFVLLDFWATWCGPCKGETPHLKAVHEAFGKDDRLAMVGLSLDQETAEPKKYVAENGMAWSQGFLGDWQATDLPGKYGVRGIPSIWLIGPDGKVVAKDLRGDRIKAAVAEALGRK
jgi:peroxiredoxin